MKGLDGVAVPSDWRRGSAYWEVSRPTFQTSTCVVLPLSPTKYWEMMKDYFKNKELYLNNKQVPVYPAHQGYIWPKNALKRPKKLLEI